jgi:hypothetical protein
MNNSILFAAISGMLVGTVTPAFAEGSSDKTEAPSADKHACKGQNGCKGHGGCKTDKHACKGQNACKGQGGCKGK